jgi:hypothetical protein
MLKLTYLTHPQPWFCKLFVKYFNIVSKAPFPKVRVCTIPSSCCDLLRRKGWQISAQNCAKEFAKSCVCRFSCIHASQPAVSLVAKHKKVKLPTVTFL